MCAPFGAGPLARVAGVREDAQVGQTRRNVHAFVVVAALVGGGLWLGLWFVLDLVADVADSVGQPLHR